VGRAERILRSDGAPVPRRSGTLEAADLYGSPNALIGAYENFRVDERVLLTGHSHQAWPDVGLEGQRQAWLDAAERVDGKWDRAFERAERVREGYRKLLGDDRGLIALGGSTHELVVRFLSALPLRTRPRLVTTDGEFHTIRRQLDRLEEEGLEVVRVSTSRAADIAPSLAAQVDDRTAAVLVSSVLFKSAQRVPDLASLAAACSRVGSELLVDAYHHLNVIPMELATEGLESAFVVGGGYKYCQLGEGNCFLRFPEDCNLRPAVTGWFSEFTALADPGQQSVVYGQGADRFAGSTYDPTSHYRASAVLDFFDEVDLNPQFLRQVSQHQVGLLMRSMDELDLDPSKIDRDRSVALESVGGFLALHAPRAGDLSAGLLERGVHTDFRGSVLRMGPAPYVSDRQITDAMGHLAEVVEALAP